MAEHRLEGFPDHGIASVFLAQPAGPQVHIGGTGINLFQAVLQVSIPGDIGKPPSRPQAIGDSHVIVGSQTVIPAALDIERGQVKATGQQFPADYYRIAAFAQVNREYMRAHQAG